MLLNVWPVFWSFLKVGIFAYGGGPSMIPLMEQEVVQSRHWMNLTEFADILALGNTLPGPIATKMALAVGYKVSGYLGATVALTALLLPSTILMLALVLFFMSFKDSPRVQAAMRGVRPAVVGLLFVVAYDVGKTSVSSIPSMFIALAVFFLSIFTNLHPAIAMVISGLIGMIFM
jgi:chromate transporter